MSDAKQRRAEQNRIAQRNFRQRKQEERQALENRLHVAEQHAAMAAQLHRRCVELEKTCEDLLKENKFLRSNVPMSPISHCHSQSPSQYMEMRGHSLPTGNMGFEPLSMSASSESMFLRDGMPYHQKAFPGAGINMRMRSNSSVSMNIGETIHEQPSNLYNRERDDNQVHGWLMNKGPSSYDDLNDLLFDGQ